jgi:virginiamycin A acetyltransferase
MSLNKDPSSYIVEPYDILSYDSRNSDGNLPIIQIGKKCSIGKNCTFVLSNHLTNRFTTFSSSPYHLFSHNKGNPSSYSKGDILIKNDVWVGANCTILDGLTIENGAIIAAGSVVVKNVPAYAIVGGNPAKIIKYRFPPNIIEEIEQLNFWNLSIDEINKFDIYTADIINIIAEIKKHRDYNANQ